jgi:hypothetical protein
MEFIEGETLSDYIKKGPVKLTEAVSIAGQVAEALKEAHAKEIVHRDIKSANVMLTSQGIAKVLDFGLAKTNASTMLTRMGSTLGTVAYMSPEQARGQEVDGRTDLYSLGTMLYEMVAGKLPFAGDYEQAVLYAILNEPPEPLTAVRTGVPMDMERVVSKLLSKEAEYRYQSAAGLLADLKSLDLTGSGISRRSMTAMSAADMQVAPAATGIPTWMWGVVAGVLILGLAAGWLAKPAPEPEPKEPSRFSLILPELVGRLNAKFSPDGRTFYYVAYDSISSEPKINAFSMGAGSAQVVAGTEGLDPFVFGLSRDGRWLAFRRDAQWWRMPASGGTAIAVGAGFNGPMAFGTDASVLLPRGEGLTRVMPDGTTDVLVPNDTIGVHVGPVLSVDGSSMLVSTWDSDIAPITSYRVPTDTWERETWMQGVWVHTLIPEGWAVYTQESPTGASNTVAVAVDPETFAITGDPVGLGYWDWPLATPGSVGGPVGAGDHLASGWIVG